MFNIEDIQWIKARDYSPNFIDHAVFVRMADDITGDRPVLFDFEDRTVLSKDLDSLAAIVIERQVAVYGLPEDLEDRLDTLKRLLSDQIIDTMEEFIYMFNQKFPVGTYCIWDRSLLDKKELILESKHTIVRIEGIHDNYLHLRSYIGSKMEPRYILEYGGLDSPELYRNTTIHVTELFNQEEDIRYPKDGKETAILELFLEIHRSVAS